MEKCNFGMDNLFFLVIDGFSAEWKTDDDSLFSQGIDIQIFK